MEFWAHSGTPGDHRDWQPLRDHLRRVAALAARRGRPHGIGRIARLAGLLHDLGKFDPEVQRRIAGADIHVDHSTAGGAVLLSRAAGPDRIAAELLAYAILGHHAGLPDRLHRGEGQRASGGTLNDRLTGFGPARLAPEWETEVPFDLAGLAEEMRAKIGAPERAGWNLALLARMVFSCLVDADFRDTEEHYARIGQGPRRDRDWPTLATVLPDLLARFDAHMAEKAEAKDSDLNRLRRDILAHVRGKATLPPGLFTLTVPTGGGKTLASLGFALDHAQHHGHQRVVYAIPFTSIIDQTAAIFREVLGEGVVLEHHSAIEEARGRKDPDEAAGRDKLKLAMEDWAAPVVVTTNVQLFESLFAARPSRARKLHAIAGSVIVLDEAQAIPRPLLLPCVRMIDALARHWGCTVVLCTATQPAFHKGRLALDLNEGRELVPDPRGLAARLRRARIARAGTMDDAALCEALAGTPQGLVIVNTRKHALELFRAAQAADIDGLLHLSTRQCAAHRRTILAEVRRRLAAGEPCRVVATSLVEAGVDLDFPRVWRAEAGLDQIVQAAGRCNREDKRPVEESVVTVFGVSEDRITSEVRDLAAAALRALDASPDLQSLNTIERYFEEVYWKLGEKLDCKKVMDAFTFTPLSGTNFAFRSVAEDFRMVEDESVPIVVRLEEARESLAKLGAENVSSGTLHRELQSFVVQVSPKDRAKLIHNGHAEFVHKNLRGDQFAVLTSAGMSLYSKEIGLEWERAEELPDHGLV